MPISLSGDGIISGVSTLNTIQTFVGTAASFTGNVSVGGTLTYEDVTNVDSIGVITARSGIIVTGIVTATSFVGNVTGTVTGTASTASFATTSFGLSGTPNITVGFATATSAVVVGSAVTLNSSGINVVGVVTATSFVGDGSQLSNLPGISKGRLYFGINN